MHHAFIPNPETKQLRDKHIVFDRFEITCHLFIGVA